MKIETYLPLFPGFYETIFQPDESQGLDDINDERELNGLDELETNDVDWAYEDYEEDVAHQAVEVVEKWLKALNLITSIEFDKIHRPKFYNWNNDAIYVTIEVSDKNLETIVAELKENESDWSTYLKANFTSRDGFISYYGNTILEWEQETNNYTKLSAVEIASILDFLLRLRNYDEYSLYNNISAYVQGIDWEKETTKIL